MGSFYDIPKAICYPLKGDYRLRSKIFQTLKPEVLAAERDAMRRLIVLPGVPKVCQQSCSQNFCRQSPKQHVNFIALVWPLESSGGFFSEKLPLWHPSLSRSSPRQNRRRLLDQLPCVLGTPSPLKKPAEMDSI